MKRNQCMLDLLRPENNDNVLMQHYLSRAEYTTDDLDQIVEVAQKVIEAAKNRRSELQK